MLIAFKLEPFTFPFPLQLLYSLQGPWLWGSLPLITWWQGGVNYWLAGKAETLEQECSTRCFLQNSASQGLEVDGWIMWYTHNENLGFQMQQSVPLHMRRAGNSLAPMPSTLISSKISAFWESSVSYLLLPVRGWVLDLLCDLGLEFPYITIERRALPA